MLNGLDLFSGIGGLAISLRDWVRPIAYCEIDRYAQGVLKTRIQCRDLPAAPIWDDIKTFDGLPFTGLVDIIYGGFPCQDLSTAGLGKGLEAERSGLFFEIMRLAKEVRPQYIFLENVPAIRKRGLAIVGHELAYAGYDCRWQVVSAAEVGAPHIRKRWFLLANATSGRLDKSKKRQVELKGGTQAFCSSNAADRDRDREGLESNRASGLQEKFTYIKCRSWWSTEPSVGRVVDGLPHRVDRIKCLGNGVVPLQAKTAFQELIGVS